VASGTAVYPGRSYRIDFSPPMPPAADAYEVDDHKEIGTVIDYADLPFDSTTPSTTRDR